MTRILLGQLTSNGDCLYATTIARQIRQDYPDCHLTWAISSICRGVIENNPDVDEIWEVPMASWDQLVPTWETFEKEAWIRVGCGDFDHAFLTQISPSNFRNYDGTIRPSLFRNYPKPITVPVETIIHLSAEERERAEEWVWTNDVDAYGNVIIFECSSKSGQSFVTPEFALEVSRSLIARKPDCCVILSTHIPLDTGSPQIIHGGGLGMRETAQLTHHADIFVGCGSGLTVVATSAAAKQNLPNVQILNRSTSHYASFKHDFDYFGKPSDHFIETTRTSPDEIARILMTVLDKGIVKAKKAHDETLALNFDWYFELTEMMLIRKGHYIDAAHSLTVTAERYGWTKELRAFGLVFIEPFLDLDSTAIFPDRLREIEAFRAAIGTSWLRKVG